MKLFSVQRQMPESNMTAKLRSVIWRGMSSGGVTIIATEGLSAVITIQYSGKRVKSAQILSIVRPTMKNAFSDRVLSRKNCGMNRAKRFLTFDADIVLAVWFIRTPHRHSLPGTGG